MASSYEELQSRLASLRRLTARIDRKYGVGKPASLPPGSSTKQPGSPAEPPGSPAEPPDWPDQPHQRDLSGQPDRLAREEARVLELHRMGDGSPAAVVPEPDASAATVPSAAAPELTFAQWLERNRHATAAGAAPALALSNQTLRHKTKPTAPGAATLLPGAEAATGRGKHWEMEKAYPLHGTMETARLAALPRNLLGSISSGLIPDVDPARIAFLDTETTGLAGGTGTVAFVTGVGRITPEGFVVRQFFLRDFDEEASVLAALGEHLEAFDVLVTYNGKAFDQPLLETRYRMARQRPPFGRMEHLDLLYGSRRLWKLRYESCRLVNLEAEVLGVERVGDVPGHLIPLLYFDYLRNRRAGPLEPVFEHNRLDIVSLACLTSIVPRAFQAPHQVDLAGTEMIGLGRWLIGAGREDDGLVLLRRAVAQHIPDALLFRALWDIAMTEKKLERGVAAFGELVESRNPYRVAALEELAKHAEHVAKDAGRALEYTLAALAQEESAELRRREERLRRKVARPRAGRLVE